MGNTVHIMLLQEIVGICNNHYIYCYIRSAYTMYYCLYNVISTDCTHTHSYLALLQECYMHVIQCFYRTTTKDHVINNTLLL